MTDTRPENCRHRLQDENKPYPRSGCNACGKNIMTGLGRECSYKSPMASPDVTDLEQKVAEALAKDDPHPSSDLRAYRSRARAAIAICAEEMAEMVKRAFKDGLSIGENVTTTPDLAWETSKVRADLAAIRAMGKGERG